MKKYAILPFLIATSFAAHADYATSTGVATSAATGSPAHAGDYSVAIGNNARAIQGYGVAIGENARVGSYKINDINNVPATMTNYDGVAIGANSYSNRTGIVNGYLKPTDITPDIYAPSSQIKLHSTWNATAGAVSIGNDGTDTDAIALDRAKITRQLIGVAAGSEDTDAVNVAQLKELEKRIGATINVTNHNIKLPNFKELIETFEVEVDTFDTSAGLTNTRDTKKVTLKNALIEHRDAINTLSKSITTNNSNNGQLSPVIQTEINKLDNQLGQQDHKIKDLTNTVSGVSTKVQQNTESITSLKAEQAKQIQEFTSHKADYTQFKTHTDSRFNEQSLAIQSLETKMQTFETNVNQRIEEVDEKLKHGIANTVAIANLPQNIVAGGTTVSAAVGGYDGQNALAVGLSGSNASGQLVFKGSAGVSLGSKANGGRKISYGAGIGYTF